MDSQTKRTGDLLDLIAAGRLIGFVGAGKLAGSVIRGLVLAKFCSPGEIIASEPNESLRAALRYEVGIHVAEKNAEVAGQAELIFIGVKLAVVLPVLREVASLLNEKIVISLAAGVRLEAMEPTAIARGSRTTNDDVDLARKIFSAIGVVVEVNEEQIDAVTALAGSGPAFVYTVIEALAEGGKKMGLAPDTALTLATQTVLGAAQLASESKLSPEELRKLVVTPGGTTAAGLAALEKLKTAEGLIAAVQAATKRGQEMAKENL